MKFTSAAVIPFFNYDNRQSPGTTVLMNKRWALSSATFCTRSVVFSFSCELPPCARAGEALDMWLSPRGLLYFLSAVTINDRGTTVCLKRRTCEAMEACEPHPQSLGLCSELPRLHVIATERMKDTKNPDIAAHIMRTELTNTGLVCCLAALGSNKVWR